MKKYLSRCFAKWLYDADYGICSRGSEDRDNYEFLTVEHSSPVPEVYWDELSDPIPERWRAGLSNCTADAIHVLRLKTAELIGDTHIYLDCNRKLIDEIYWMDHKCRWRYWSLRDIVTSVLPQRALWLNDIVFPLVFPESRNPFHFFFDGLIKLFAVQDIIAFEQLTILVSHESPSWQLDALRWLFPNINVTILKRPISYRFKELVACSSIRTDRIVYHPAAIRWARDLFLNKLREFSSADSKVQRRIFLTRGRVSGRRLLNEAEVIEVLKDYGFVSINLESLSFSDQVRTLRDAEIVIGAHGAAFSFTLFSTNATVIELFGDCFSAFFASLSRYCNNKYIAIHNDNGENNVTSRNDFSVDLNRLKAVLRVIPGSRL